MTVVLDASVLIAHFDPEDAHHTRATTTLGDTAGDGLLAHRLTIAETLVAAVAGGVVDDMLEQLRVMGLESVGLDADAPVRLARLRERTRLRMPDCCVLDAALQHRAAVGTFDERLARAARELGLSVRP